MSKRLPVICPSCDHRLSVKRMSCENCGTDVEGQFALPELASMSLDDQAFICAFVKASGSLKEMAVVMKVSYPTVRNRLDEVITKLEASTP